MPGVTKGRRSKLKDTWWWTDDVRKAIGDKKECYRHTLIGVRTSDNIERYKVAKKTTKRAESEAKGRAYDDIY